MYAQLSAADKNIRSTCYPYFSEYSSGDIPVYGRTSLIQFDSSNLILKWNETLPIDAIDQTWVYTGVEKADDAYTSGLVGF